MNESQNPQRAYILGQRPSIRRLLEWVYTMQSRQRALRVVAEQSRVRRRSPKNGWRLVSTRRFFLPPRSKLSGSVILMFDGHAAAGVWLSQRTFTRAIETDLMEVRKALASRELIVFETTGIAHRPAMAMESAERAIDRRLVEEEARAFVAAIDVENAREAAELRHSLLMSQSGVIPMTIKRLPSRTCRFPQRRFLANCRRKP